MLDLFWGRIAAERRSDAEAERRGDEATERRSAARGDGAAQWGQAPDGGVSNERGLDAHSAEAGARNQGGASDGEAGARNQGGASGEEAGARSQRKDSGDLGDVGGGGAAIGGIVPHAGWVYSGLTAARTVARVARWKPETVVVFGAVHVLDHNQASVFRAGRWEGIIETLGIDAELCDELLRGRVVTDDADAHDGEHSIEVELPLIAYAMPGVRIVPVMVRPGDWVAGVGRAAADAAMQLGRRVAFLASTDLTHYGPMFGFTPAGRGEEGVRWAKEVNDRRFIERVGQMDADGVVPEAVSHRNACGAGAVAAMLGAMAAYGLEGFEELEHTCSAEVAGRDSRRSGTRRDSRSSGDDNSVGYVAGVVGGRGS